MDEAFSGFAVCFAERKTTGNTGCSVFICKNHPECGWPTYPRSLTTILEYGNPVTQWGRLIFYVSDVDRFWAYLKEQGLRPQRPQDASWGERYFHLSDPDGHELSFARPI